MTQPKYPIVLLHGLFGFDKIIGGSIKYWNGIDDDLNTSGKAQVFTTEQPISSSPWLRAAAIIEQLLDIIHTHYSDQENSIRFNLICHSLGGIDARIVRHLCPQMVESICTIATPHYGSPLANYVEENIVPIMSPLLNLVNFDVEAIPFLKTKPMSELNNLLNDHEHDIPLYSYSAQAPRDKLSLPLRQLYDVIFAEEGENDGFVSVASAKYGNYCGILQADHLEQIGFSFGEKYGSSSDYTHLTFFRTLVKLLVDNGH